MADARHNSLDSPAQGMLRSGSRHHLTIIMAEHFTHEWNAEQFAAFLSALRGHCVDAKLDQILSLLQTVITKETQMAGELDALTAEVTANTDAEASAVVLLGQLHDLLVAAGTDPAKLQALTTQLSTSKDALAAAIVANTPAA